MSFPFVRARVEEGSLELHGAWFAIHHGELHWRNKLTRRFEVVPMLCYDASMPSSKISLEAPARPVKKSLSSPQLGPSKSPATAPAADDAPGDPGRQDQALDAFSLDGSQFRSSFKFMGSLIPKS